MVDTGHRNRAYQTSKCPQVYWRCLNVKTMRPLELTQHLESLDSLKDKAVEYFRGWLQYYTVTQYCYF